MARNLHIINFATIIQRLEHQAHERGERMTDVRRDVVRALCDISRPVGAYDLLAFMNRKRGKPLSAMSLYRTLDFLQKMGLAVKVDGGNAYMLCQHGGHDHGHVIMVCDGCGDAHEVEEKIISQQLEKIAATNQLKLQHNIVEMHGLCRKCR